LSASADEPANLQSALSYTRWKEAMDEEYSAIMKNKTCMALGSREAWFKCDRLSMGEQNQEKSRWFD
jgi:hypothetical protein